MKIRKSHYEFEGEGDRPKSVAIPKTYLDRYSRSRKTSPGSARSRLSLGSRESIIVTEVRRNHWDNPPPLSLGFLQPWGGFLRVLADLLKSAVSNLQENPRCDYHSFFTSSHHHPPPPLWEWAMVRTILSISKQFSTRLSFARAGGIEPPIAVLETAVIPFNYARMFYFLPNLFNKPLYAEPNFFNCLSRSCASFLLWYDS